MRHALLIAASLAIVGCDAVNPYAGLGVGTNIGGVNGGTGVSGNPFRVRGALGNGGRTTTAAPRPTVVTPIREYRTADGRLCRDFDAGGSIGTACLGADGQWRVVAN
ncbi:MAG TPA: hypothetical protein VK943_04505 [Arenibaculum sp.]|nr:hypothetical protein [Arenibaculum sp.]